MNYRVTFCLRGLGAAVLIMVCCNGCFLTKVLTVPMRVGGAVLSVIPVAGDAAHESIDEAAEIIDDMPL